MNYICCFTGHRPPILPFLENTASEKYVKLRSIIKSHVEKMIIEKNVDIFLSGMALGTDILCAEIILEIKENKPNIELHCILPCADQDKYWSESQSKKYWSIIDKADQVKYTMTIYTPYSMLIRNKYMVNQSDHIIAIWNNEKKGGTWNTIQYAKKQSKQANKEIIYINTNTL